jgi:hypothetical protein
MTWVTPTASAEVPLKMMLVPVVLNVAADVGELMLIVGGVVSVCSGVVTASTLLAELPALS